MLVYSNCSTDCDVEPAMDSTLLAAATSTWLRVRSAVAVAKSVSRINDSAAETFSNAMFMLLTAESTVSFKNEPSLPRIVAMSVMALATT